MKFEIKSRFDGSVLFSIETDSWRLAIEAAIKAKANLRYANLRSADLRYADLRSADLRSANLRYADLRSADLRSADLRYADPRYADLRSADLRSANLRYADLRSADLRYADLRYADLRSADLRSADLRYADLRYANLRYADLSSADLSSADLRSADLRSADLSSAVGVTAYQMTPLKMLEFQPGTIRLFKLVNSEGVGPFNGGIKYEIGKEYKERKANCDEQQQCAAGLNVATLDWCLLRLSNGYRIFVVEFEAKDIAAIPIATDGKIRVKKLKVIEELDLSKYLPKDKKTEAAA